METTGHSMMGMNPGGEPKWAALNDLIRLSLLSDENHIGVFICKLTVDSPSVGNQGKTHLMKNGAYLIEHTNKAHKDGKCSPSKIK